ncbi:MAG: hypothetical protein U5L95_04910 [Candidatus Saccharibacteria bacterium]|nr:hypothetical protein [Candidatus Saccharibacteria bacterium]
MQRFLMRINQETFSPCEGCAMGEYCTDVGEAESRDIHIAVGKMMTAAANDPTLRKKGNEFHPQVRRMTENHDLPVEISGKLWKCATERLRDPTSCDSVHTVNSDLV